MTESRKPMPDGFGDDAPDLAVPEWRKTFAKVKAQRGRPKAARTKVSTTIRLSPEELEYFKAGGPGWQSRIDEALRKAAGLQS